LSDDQQVWKALSSPHRRAMLDALRDGPLTTTAFCELLPELSRYAVMQHLGVLERAAIVLVRRNGRERWNELNAVPIQRELERWLNSFQQASASQLLAFERHLKAVPSRKEESP
jgi:DNA-binding transcriptional ArsR family regulator